MTLFHLLAVFDDQTARCSEIDAVDVHHSHFGGFYGDKDILDARVVSTEAESGGGSPTELPPPDSV